MTLNKYFLNMTPHIFHYKADQTVILFTDVQNSGHKNLNFQFRHSDL